MSISYGELAVIGAMTDDELTVEYASQSEQPESEDRDDTVNALLAEMEERGLPHP